MVDSPFVWGAGGAQMTPEQIVAQRKIAEAMMARASDYSPVQSWSQGMARVAEGLVGGLRARSADMASQENAASEKELLTSLFSGGPPPATVSSPVTAAPTTAPAAVAAPTNVAPGKIYSNDEPSPLDPPSGEDRSRMVATILGEAGNQGSVGQNAVASVIRNRAVNGGYGGNTPSAVVTAPNQFEPWNTEAGRAGMGRAAADPAQAASADQAIAMAYGEGGTAPADPTNGAKNFIQPALQAKLGRPMPAWAQQPGTMIGDHKFIGGAPVDPTQQPYQVAGPATAAPAAVAAVPSDAVAAAVPASAGVQAVAQATPASVNPKLIAAMTSPYVSAGTKTVAAAIFQNQLKGETTDELKEYQFDAKQRAAAGQSPISFTGWKTALKQAGATKVTQNADMKGEDSFAKAAGTAQAKRFDDLAADGQQAHQMISDINTLTDLGKNIGTGKTAEFKAAVGPYAEALGIKVDGLSDIQAYEGIINRVAPSLRVKGSGAQSDYELKNFLKSLPALGNTEEGNAISAATMKGLQENKIRAAEIGSMALNGQITRTEAEKQLRNLPDPMVQYREYMKANRGAPTAIGAKAAESGWQDLGDGVRIREKK